MKLAIIAAIAKNYVVNKGYPIGKNGKLPWDLHEDIQRFKSLTENNIVIMGRKTYESIPEKFRPLKNRFNIVVTKQKDYENKGILVVNSLDEALAHIKSDTKNLSSREFAYFIGGESIYKKSISLVNCLEITHVNQIIHDADAFFPEIGLEWREVKREDKKGYSFITYQKSDGRD